MGIEQDIMNLAASGVATAIAAAPGGILKGDPGNDGADGADGAPGIGGTPEFPGWSQQTGANWLAFKAIWQADVARYANLPKPTCRRSALPSAMFGAGTNQYAAAATLPEGLIVTTPHTTPNAVYAKTRLIDTATMTCSDFPTHLGDGSSRTNGVVVFPDGDILPVPSNSTTIRTQRLSKDDELAFTLGSPGSAAYLGGALWPDGVSAVLAPHTQNYACLVNKNTGVRTVLTGYDFGGGYACAGVRRCATGEYYFVPHRHNKHVFLNPDTMAFRVLATPVPNIIDAFCGCTNLSTGEIYVATHKAPCSVIINPFTGEVTDTLPPSGPGYIAPALLDNSNEPNAKFRTCVRTPDDRVVLIPFKHSKAWLYDRATNSHIQLPATYDLGAVACGALTPMGDVILIPWNGSTAYKLATGFGVPVNPQIVFSPLTNGL